MRAVLGAAWALLSACFLSALLLLRCVPARPPGGGFGVVCGLFQDLIRYGKTKCGCGQRPGWLRLLQVPKRWFTHFYVVSVLWNGFLLIWLFRAEFLGESLPSWIQHVHHALGRDSQSEDTDSEHFSALLVLLLLWLHSCRRLAECLWTSVFSSGVIHIVQYCFGIVYYVAVGSTVLCQVPTNIRNGKELSVQISWYHIVGVVMYIWASLHQHRCLVILANLRKSKSGKVINLNHSVPFGDWFESVSCPHYFAELLIYVSMAITLGFHNVTWWSVVMFLESLVCQRGQFRRVAVTTATLVFKQPVGADVMNAEAEGTRKPVPSKHLASGPKTFFTGWMMSLRTGVFLHLTIEYFGPSRDAGVNDQFV